MTRTKYKVLVVTVIVLVAMLYQRSVLSAEITEKGPVIGSQIVIGKFAVDATEVTVGQLKKKFRPAEKRTNAEQQGGGYEYSGGWVQRAGWVWHAPYGQSATDSEPVVHITWFEAKEHCSAIGGRLPTLDEWQLAAYTETRELPTDGYEQGRTYRYPVGDEPTGMNTAGKDAWPRHAPAGMTRRGVNGLYDMGANVWEWLADEKSDTALTAGGSWWYTEGKTQQHGAQYKPKDFAAVYIGFRCVYDK